MDYTGDTLRFWPGYSVDVTKEPFKGTSKITTKVLNYVRQNEMLSYEDLRGMYSRGKYPVGQQIKVTPAGAYYINPYRYSGFEVNGGVQQSTVLATHMVISRTNPNLFIDWFRTAFRSEYVWESGSMFPSFQNGNERLEAVLWWRHRFLSSSASVFYDYGAWTGWKDDFVADSLARAVFPNGTSEVNTVVGGRRKSGNGQTTDVVLDSPFATSFQPVAVGPALPQTVELVTHLVLVPERRGSV